MFSEGNLSKKIYILGTHVGQPRESMPYFDLEEQVMTGHSGVVGVRVVVGMVVGVGGTVVAADLKQNNTVITYFLLNIVIV